MNREVSEDDLLKQSSIFLSFTFPREVRISGRIFKFISGKIIIIYICFMKKLFSGTIIRNKNSGKFLFFRFFIFPESFYFSGSFRKLVIYFRKYE